MNDPTVKMLYGRLNVSRRGFFTDSLLVSYRPVPSQSPKLPAYADAPAFLSKQIYRAQLKSEAGKRARWFAETVAGPKTSSGIATRNSLMGEPVANLASADRGRSDILHEYFVPPDRFNDFIKACQDLIPPSDQELLNITLRYVAADSESVMAFAPTPRIAAVMSFSQEVSPEASIVSVILAAASICLIVCMRGGIRLLPSMAILMRLLPPSISTIPT
jgi:hypothetical protein